MPLREPFGMPVATLLNVPAPPAATIGDVGELATELGLESTVDDGKADGLEESNEDDESSRLELDDAIEEGEDGREDLEDVPAAATVALFPVITLMIAGRGPEVEALMLTNVR